MRALSNPVTRYFVVLQGLQNFFLGFGDERAFVVAWVARRGLQFTVHLWRSRWCFRGEWVAYRKCQSPFQCLVRRLTRVLSLSIFTAQWHNTNIKIGKRIDQYDLDSLRKELTYGFPTGIKTH